LDLHTVMRLGEEYDRSGSGSCHGLKIARNPLWERACSRKRWVR